MMDTLVQRDLGITLEDEKLEDITKQELLKMNRLACGSIHLYLIKDIKYFVMRENVAAKLLWKKLEDKCMTKSVEN